MGSFEVLSSLGINHHFQWVIALTLRVIHWGVNARSTTSQYDDDDAEQESGSGLPSIPEGEEGPPSPNATEFEGSTTEVAQKAVEIQKLPSPVKSGKRSGGASWLSHSDEYKLALSQVTDSCSSLGPEARRLDRRLLQTLITAVRGPSLQLLLALKGDAQRYTYRAIALWKHAELGASNLRTADMAAMQTVKFQGDAGQWKMQVMAPSGEIYASGVTIEHCMMGCLLSSFQGKSPQVQSMMVSDINSDKVGPDMQLEELVSAYSTFIATMNSIAGPSRGINGVGQGEGKKKAGGGAKF